MNQPSPNAAEPAPLPPEVVALSQAVNAAIRRGDASAASALLSGLDSAVRDLVGAPAADVLNIV